MFAVLFGLMYLMFIRPQSRRRREAQEMQSKLGSGDKVITIGGLYGTVESADDESVILEISPGVTARYARQAIAPITERAGGDEPDTSADESEHEPASSPIQETKKVK
jgi:preprotein translocase subunit YajC